jgi:hypothetical protein
MDRVGSFRGGCASLREVDRQSVQQRAGEPERRWFTCDEADLFVWLRSRYIVAFEFAYDKTRGEHAVRWRPDGGLSRMRIDDGEVGHGHKRTPIAVPDGGAELGQVALRFEAVGSMVDPRVYRFVLSRLYAGC